MLNTHVRSIVYLSQYRPITLLLTLLIAALSGALSVRVHATPSAQDPAQGLGGYLEAMVNEERVLLPALKVDYEVTVHGDLAQVRVVQTFSNPMQVALSPRYLFPLHEEAAVSALTMHVGDEVVEGVFQRKAQAEKTFAAAQKAGKVASLVRQQRPNMFTQRIANLMPGAAVRVALDYTQRLRKRDGEYELTLPLVVGPRFEPQTPVSAGPSVALNEPVPYVPVTGLTLPVALETDRVGLAIDLEAPVPVLAVASASHALDVRRVDAKRLDIGLAKGRVQDNRDFTLRFRLGSEDVSAGLLSHWETTVAGNQAAAASGGYFSLLIEPPANLSVDALLPREMVFLLDCSGSMSGRPMDASKAFMRAALEGLRPTDRFRIIRFSDSATEFSKAPLAATPANIAAGLAYTAQLRGGGGTVMTSGVYQAFAAAEDPAVVRNVVFLTDGYIGNEAEVLRLVGAELGAARLYALGVGSGVNRYLLEELARVGRGFVRYMDPTESVDEVARSLANRLAEPVLTDLEIDWGNLQVTDVTPAALPDLFAGESLRVQGRYAAGAEGQIELRGIGRGGQIAKPLWVQLPETEQRPPVRQIWARARVSELMNELIAPASLRRKPRSDAQLQEAVTQIGERYGLLTRWTALVAVSRQVYQNRPEDSLNADVAVPMVAGVSAQAYGQGAAWPAFSGAGTPEPAVWSAMLAVGLLALLGWGRSRQAARRKNSQG